MIRDFDKNCRGCAKRMRFEGVAKTITGRYDRSPYERAWWYCNDKECDEFMLSQAFYVGEHKNGERWET